jgi:hypothetical protein
MAILVAEGLVFGVMITFALIILTLTILLFGFGSSSAR